jgi:hypothetical protein
MEMGFSRTIYFFAVNDEMRFNLFLHPRKLGASSNLIKAIIFFYCFFTSIKVGSKKNNDRRKILFSVCVHIT